MIIILVVLLVVVVAVIMKTDNNDAQKSIGKELNILKHSDKKPVLCKKAWTGRSQHRESN